MKEQDQLRRFIFEDLGVRGEWVKLNESWRQSIEHQQASPVIIEQLGQALAAVTMLSAIVKFKGSMILQAQGAGVIRTLVAQSSDERNIRGLVRCNEDVDNASFEQMYGQGQLILTIESENSSPYQGVVPLAGRNLGEALETYFSQSEQLNTRVWLVADQHQAAGLLLQELPSRKGDREDWARIEMLAQTVTDHELLELDCEPLLYRLFNQEKVRVFDAEPVQFRCACSRTKIENTLRSLGRDDLEDILQTRGDIEVNCEFCGKNYSFDRIDVEGLFADLAVTNATDTRH
ncbi:Hsp33 family molecular chaperone HslO [Methylotuvimicrobium buryatense]|uniref:Hsp33 family molecular chaperone HslO n=1 Tax=Methylotuvimicrobium buryatense TaxID=95641 RepID=A0A4V1IJN7_METBY|nr:Hsp33 family molecular chaperone HslO [Methylotuvimicrobium buryatense]QCW82045.1 Hsp33 family molecular chaperone HslO [Methylotuvimicrobium buryatense]